MTANAAQDGAERYAYTEHWRTWFETLRHPQEDVA